MSTDLQGMRTRSEERTCRVCGETFPVEVRYAEFGEQRFALPAPSLCPTHRMEAEAAEAAERQAVYEAEAARRIEAAIADWERSIPPRWHSAATGTVYPESRRLRLEAWDGRRSVFLQGPVGCGKTYAAVALAALVWQRTAQTVAFHDVGLLLEQLRPGRRGIVADVVEDACRVDLLILDDLAVANPTPWAVEKLSTIINARYQHERPTIMTAEVTPAALATVFGVDRISSRIAQMSDVIAFPSNSADRRLNPEEAAS